MINTDKTSAKSEEYKYQDLTGLILKLAFQVHNTLGCGFLEKVYERSLVQELKSNGLKVSGYEVALILNFAKPRLEYRRVVR